MGGATRSPGKYRLGRDLRARFFILSTGLVYLTAVYQTDPDNATPLLDESGSRQYSEPKGAVGRAEGSESSGAGQAFRHHSGLTLLPNAADDYW